MRRVGENTVTVGGTAKGVALVAVAAPTLTLIEPVVAHAGTVTLSCVAVAPPTTAGT